MGSGLEERVVPRELQNVERFIAEVVRPAFAFAEDSEIWYAKVDIDLVRRVERQLIHDLQPVDNDPRTKTAPKVPMRICHESAAWFDGGIKQHVTDVFEKRGQSMADRIVS
jgi:hypothetical protein